RAAQVSPHLTHRKLTGFSIGKGQLSARLYDKPEEIASKSKKFWMYDVWGVESVARDHRVIRVEYQHRREALRELGVDSFADLVEKLDRLWAYDTGSWLRLVDDASKH